MFTRLFAALRAVVRRRDVGHEIDDEIHDHLERDVAWRLRRGASPGEARRLALADFGGVEATRDSVRDARRITAIDDLRRDLRFAARRLARRPAYTALVVTTIGLGIAACTTVFTVVDGILLKPLPLATPQDIVTLWQTRPSAGVERDDVAPGTFLDWQARARTLSSVGAANPSGVSLRHEGSTEHVDAWQVSDGLFALLGARPLRGRSFEPGDFVPGAEPVVLLDYGFWQRRLGGDPQILGRRLLLDDQPRTVIGVMPASFELPEHTNLWMPWVVTPEQRTDRFAPYLRVFGRLARGATVAEARAELATIARALEGEYPRSNRGVGAAVIGLTDILVGSRRPLLWTLLGAAFSLLLVTVINVGALHLTQLDRQQRETAVRLALGARRAAIVRPLLVEASLIAVLGGAAGAGLAAIGVRAVHVLGPAALPRLVDVVLDWRALGVAITLSLLAAATLAIVSARRTSMSEDHRVPASRGVAGTRRGTQLRRTAVGLQLALSLVLLVGTSLLVRSFIRLMSEDRGYRTDHVMAFSVWVHEEYPGVEARTQYVRDVLDRLGALPGVTSVALGSALPLAQQITGEDADIVMEGASVVPGEEPQARGIAVWPSWFSTLGTPLRRGRPLTVADDARAERVVMVNEAFVKRFSPDRDPIGRVVSVGLMGRAVPTRIVGVVGDTRHARLDGPPEPGVFIPWLQQPIAAITFVVRTSGDPQLIAPAIPRTMFAIDPRVALDRLSTLDELVAHHVRERTFMLVLLGVFGAVSVLVACIGVFGVMNQAVAERRREIAVRMALGAAPGRIVGEFAREATAMAAGGIGAGLVVAAAGTSAITSFLYDVQRFDPLALGAAVVLLASCAFIAALWPAMRASRTPPGAVIQRE
ncbi:MAG: ABC transporter permease [Gemmatimonadaceae bacterium]|nr:ABC transporter permease [Gemmatimonadaceae bacterium]